MGIYDKDHNINITTEVLSLISEIDEFKGAWRTLGLLAPEHLALLKRAATIESIGSSTRIEGAKLTDQQVEKLLGNLAIKRFTSRDKEKVAGKQSLFFFEPFTCIYLVLRNFS